MNFLYATVYVVLKKHLQAEEIISNCIASNYCLHSLQLPPFQIAVSWGILRQHQDNRFNR